MTGKDRIKLQDAGFTILRIRWDDLKIVKMTDSSSGWSDYSKHTTQASLKREIERINKEEKKTIFE